MSSGAATSLDTRSQIWESLNPAQREIRLFIVEPDKDEIAIAKGRLITRSLEQHLFYDAVSHAWGSHSDAEALIINGAEWLVTTSIYEALQRLREPEREKCIWIDALCINQHDLQDRAQQVKIMEYIFHRATSVQAWLGSGSYRIHNLISDMCSSGGLQNDYFTPDMASDLGQRAEVSIVDFARLGYWARTWVVQEIFLARDVRFLHDRQTLEIKHLLALWNRYSKRKPHSDHADRNCIKERLGPILLRLATLRLYLTKILSLNRFSQCRDARDRIYGLMGIITSLFGPGFMNVDYEQSIADVYTSLVGNLILKTGFLQILNQAEYMWNSVPGLPTWVPDFSSAFNGQSAYRRLRLLNRFNAAGVELSDGFPVEHRK